MDAVYQIVYYQPQKTETSKVNFFMMVGAKALDWIGLDLMLNSVMNTFTNQL